MLHFDSSHPIVTRGSRISRAPPYHTLPAFLNLNGSKTSAICKKLEISQRDQNFLNARHCFLQILILIIRV